MNVRRRSTPNSVVKEIHTMVNHYSIRDFVVQLLLATLFILALGWSLSANAQETTYDASFDGATKEGIPINVLVGQSRVINFDRSIGRFSISNPEVAEAVMVSPTQVLVNGKTFGQVNFIAWEKSDVKFIVFDVFVRANLSLIDSQIRALFPRDDIRLSQANGSVVLSGTVGEPQSAAQADAVVQAAGFKTVNMLQSPVTNMLQVQLQIRVAEVSRSKLRNLGASFLQSGGGTTTFTQGGGPGTVGTSDDQRNFVTDFAGDAVNLFLFNRGIGTTAFIRALQTNGALRSLAEPNLIAMNGQTASFLAGGEFPVPIIQAGSANAITVVFKEFGIRLNFKPTIIDEDHIRLELEPEVSTIDLANGVRFNGFVIPGLRTRRAHTGVELRDGQSFALAGLLDNSETQSLSKIPVLGDIPILGNLFKSKSFQKNETELMFIVTADLVKPVNRDDLPQMKGVDGLKSGRPLLGVEPKDGGIVGKSGFSTEPAATEGNADSEVPKRLVPVGSPGAEIKTSQTDIKAAAQQPTTTTPPAATTNTSKGATPE